MKEAESENKYNFKTKYDMIYCSHVIEHKGLGKIFDLLNDDGDLVISAQSLKICTYFNYHSSNFSAFLIWL